MAGHSCELISVFCVGIAKAGHMVPSLNIKRVPRGRWRRQGLAVALALAAGAGAILMELQPGFSLWQLLYMQSTLTFTGHSGEVISVAFSPDGSAALSGAIDRTLKLWDATSGSQIRTFIGHSGSVYSVAFSPDGRTILSGSSDRTVKLLSLIHI